MSNKELQFAYRVKRALDANLENLPESTTQSLAEARRVALARKKSNATPRRVVAPQFSLAGAGVGGSLSQPPSFAWLSRLAVAIPVLVGVMLFAGLYEYEHKQHIRELAELDVGVLSDELPLSAYLDHGFNAYLAQQGE
jgi:hypothetical protein